MSQRKYRQTGEGVEGCMAQIEGQVSDGSSDGELDKWEFCGQAVKTNTTKSSNHDLSAV